MRKTNLILVTAAKKKFPIAHRRIIDEGYCAGF
jgi:hypothetical protein